MPPISDDPPVDSIATLAELRSPAGDALLRTAAALDHTDPLAAVSALRAAGTPPSLAGAALTQTRLRARAVPKFGTDAARMFFTAAGLEQATRAAVADRRAIRLAAGGVRRIVDLGCGVGADTLAFARAGLHVDAVEEDPHTAAVAGANAAVLGLADRVTVTVTDATTVDVTGYDAVFCDPARRRGGRRVFDPDAYRPPWPFLTSLLDRPGAPYAVLKLAPGLDHDRLPGGTEAEWISVGGDVVELSLWSAPLARVPRRAVVLPRDPSRRLPRELTGDGARRAPVAPVRGWLHDPDGAVVRSHLVAELADHLDATLADGDIAYLYTDSPHATPFTRCYRVEEVLPFSLKRLRAALRARDAGTVTVLKRGSPLDPDHFRRDLRLRGSTPATVALTRVAGAPTALIVTPGTS